MKWEIKKAQSSLDEEFLSKKTSLLDATYFFELAEGNLFCVTPLKNRQTD
jgi:hypothetical protein